MLGGGKSTLLAELAGRGYAVVDPGTWVWVGVSDVGVLHEEYTAGGAVILEPPTNHGWAYEMKVQDPDGHVLRFGSEPRNEET